MKLRLEAFGNSLRFPLLGSRGRMGAELSVVAAGKPCPELSHSFNYFKENLNLKVTF